MLVYIGCIYGVYLTIIPRARMGPKPIAHEAEGKCQVLSAQPNKVRVIFDYPAICKFNLSKSRSVEPVLTDGPHYFFYLFFL